MSIGVSPDVRLGVTTESKITSTQRGSLRHHKVFKLELLTRWMIPMKTAAHRQTLWTLVPAKAGRPVPPKRSKVKRHTNTPSMMASKPKLPEKQDAHGKTHPCIIPAPTSPGGPTSGLRKPQTDRPPKNRCAKILPQTQTSTRITRTIEARAPLWTVYDTWTRFEAFPHFMKGVNDTHGLLNESRMVWRIRTGDSHVPLEAEICQQIPFQKIAWRSNLGHPHPNAGEVTFHRVSDELTQVTACFDFDLSGGHDWPGDPIPAVTQCLDWSLQCFCSVVESHVDPECESFACPRSVAVA